ncbi:MAG: hypothetical protein ACNFW9_03385 [Candidatus Kerfeldbacteria bacterium]|jgi:hypothetical protein
MMIDRKRWKQLITLKEAGLPRPTFQMSEKDILSGDDRWKKFWDYCITSGGPITLPLPEPINF